MDFDVDDLVLMSTEASVEQTGDKLSPRWVGPFQVLRRIGPLSVEIQQLGSERTIVTHAQRLQWFAGPELVKKHKDALVRTADLSLRGRYVVADIVDVRPKDNSYELQVRWWGYESDDDTWEPLTRLYHDTPRCVDEYLARPNLPVHIAEMVPGMRAVVDRRVTRAAAKERRRYAGAELRS